MSQLALTRRDTSFLENLVPCAQKNVHTCLGQEAVGPSWFKKNLEKQRVGLWHIGCKCILKSDYFRLFTLL
jgi:hypothetical protein